MNNKSFPTGHIFMAMSLDGYIATKENGLDWLGIVNAEGEDYGYAKFSSTIDTVLMGRHTYEVIREFDPWPYEGKKFAVYTRSPIDSVHGAFTISGEMRDVFKKLGDQGAKRIYVDGGQTIRTAIEAGFIADITISIIPILLGSGIKLFDEMPGLKEHKILNLTKTEHFASGLVQISYSL